MGFPPATLLCSSSCVRSHRGNNADTEQRKATLSQPICFSPGFARFVPPAALSLGAGGYKPLPPSRCWVQQGLVLERRGRFAVLFHITASFLALQPPLDRSAGGPSGSAQLRWWLQTFAQQIGHALQGQLPILKLRAMVGCRHPQTTINQAPLKVFKQALFSKHAQST